MSEKKPLTDYEYTPLKNADDNNPDDADKGNCDGDKYRQHLQEDFISNVTLHGFRYLFISGTIRRIAWWLSFFGAFTLAVILFRGQIKDYFEYNSFSIHQVDFDVKKLDFPTLTFCYNKPFTRRHFPFYKKYLGLTQKDIYRIYNAVFGEYRWQGLRPKALKVLSRLRNPHTKRHVRTYERLLHTVTDSVENLLRDKAAKSFIVNGQPKKPFANRACQFNNKECNMKDFKITFDKENSPCIQFNPFRLKRGSKVQRYYNPDDGFQMYFNLHSNMSLGREDTVSGITMYINYRGRPHYKPFATDITLQTGLLTKISLDELRDFRYNPALEACLAERTKKTASKKTFLESHTLTCTIVGKS